MKLTDISIFKPLEDIRRKMGARELGDFSLDMNWEEISLEEVARLEKDGIDVDPGELKFLEDRTIAWKNRRVLLYIRDWKLEKSRPKFHICHCATLEEMKKEGRSKRYVVSTRTDGVFNFNQIKYVNGTPIVNEKEEKLDVCKNCLESLNYNNYRADREKAFEEFDLNEFFVRFSCSPIKITPLETEKTAPLNVYAKDWNKKSVKFREDANWRCGKCGKDFSGKKKFLHCHHKDGNTFDNRPSNIEVLCVLCHAEEPKHRQLEGTADYMECLNLIRSEKPGK